MSEVVASNNFGFNTFDKFTTFITNGYMKISSKSYFSHLQYFPVDITSITIDYIGDHFMMYRGSYQWDIKHDLLLKMLKQKNTQNSNPIHLK